nr:ribosomal protein S4 [Thonningia sanguinea]WJE89172.1 ribosomal protein S4 [Thonningia sanguinea]
MRLDNVIFNLGISSTIPQARQLINHKHIFINDYIITRASFFCKLTNIISFKKQSKMLNSFFLKIQKSIQYCIINTFESKIFINKIITMNHSNFSLNKYIIMEYYTKWKKL